MPETVPAWKFWHPLPFWQVLVVAFALEIVCTIPVVALREGLGVGIPTWVGAAIGGGLMVVVIRAIAQRRLTSTK